ncbi:MAG: HEAT repeat domain-containing protein [Phycisphaerae bacterium]
MKRARIIAISIFCLAAGVINTASARSSVSIEVGVGYYPNYYRGWHHRGYYGYHRPWRRYYPYRSAIILDSGYCYDRRPQYCVPRPVIIEKQTLVLNPQGMEKDSQELFRTLRNKKTELLAKLQRGNARQIRETINELGGFSFDDTVRAALEDVLLQHPDAEVRALTAEVFGNVRNINALPALQKARLEDPKEQVRKAADNAIEKMHQR